MRRSKTQSLSARLLSASAATLLLFALAGCGSQDSADPPDLPTATDDGGGDGGGGGGGGGGGTTQPSVALSDPSPSTLTAGVGSATIVATVKTSGGGTPADGTIVTFVVSPTSVAAADDTTVPTVGGQAAAVLRGNKAGTASITAKALNVTSAAKTLGVLGPVLTIATEQTSIGASAPGSSGAVITVTAKDQQGNAVSGLAVSFSSTLGTLTPITSPAPPAGTYQVTLTSQQVGSATVSASALGSTTDSVVVDVNAGPISTLTLTPNPSQILKSSTATASSTVAIEAKDPFGNAAGGAVVNVSSEPASVGSLASTTVTLDAAGKGSVVFTSAAGDKFGTATITAETAGAVAVSKTATIQTKLDRTGEPANILLSVEPENGKITVAGVGGNERAKITAEVVDIEGNPIDDSKITSNIEFEITKAPGNSLSERPRLDGQDPTTGVLTLTTSGGIALANLQSGTRPGTVEISVRVTRGKDGALLAEPLSAVVPQITIEAGPPASVFLSRSNAVASNSDGTITHEYLAVLSDRYGSAVPDGTSVFFGQFLNILEECRTWSKFVPSVGFVSVSCDGGTLSEGVFTRASGAFPDKISDGDTWVPIAETNEDGLTGFIVDMPAAGSLTLESVPPVTVSIPEYAVGNNANLGGAVFTAGAEVQTVGGIARWPNTYAGELVNRPVYIYAETKGKGLGHSRWFKLSGVAPLKITITGPDKVSAGATVAYTLAFQDSSSPTAYWVPDLLAHVTAEAGALSGQLVYSKAWDDALTGSTWVESTSRQLTTGYPGGEAAFAWNAPAAVGKKFKIFVSAGGVLQSKEIEIQ